MSIGVIASQAFSPTKLTGLKVWLDASDIATIIDSGGFVSEWKDKSKEGNHVVQLNGVDQPSTGVDTIKGLNVLTFDGVNTFLRIADLVGGVLSQPNTIYIVFEISNLLASTMRFFDGKGGGTRHTIDILGASDDEWAMQGLSGNTKVVGVPYAISCIFNTTSSEGYINGILEITGDVGAQTLGGVTLGAGGSTGIFPFPGKIGEVIVKDGISDTAERLEVENYLFNKWGIEFDPLSLHGLKLWLDASDTGTIIDSSGNVSEWQDKSLEGNKAEQLVGVEQPKTGTRTINGLNVIDFNGLANNMVLDSQPIVGTEARTVIIVGAADDGDNQNFFINLSNSDVTGAQYRVTAEIGVRIFNGLITLSDSAEDGVGAIITVTNEANSTLENDSSNFQGYKNGVLLTGSGPAITVDTGVDVASIGDDSFGGGVGRLDGVIGEMIIYDRVLSTLEREQIEEYLSNKWNIPLSFPFAFSSDFSSDFS